MMKHLAIFDLDGTILDTLEDLTNSLNVALKQCEYPVRTREEVRQFVGNGIRKLIERGVPKGCSALEVDRVHSCFTEHYQHHCADHTKPYDGIPQLLSALKACGYQIAVVSNKADYAVQELCNQYFPDTFDVVVGEREGIARKPSPDSVNEVLRRLQIDRTDAVYIGDSDVDLATAQNAGMEEIAVTWGFRSREFLIQKGAVTLVSTPEELKNDLLTKE